ncbi:hypothetical protein GDO78_017126 [Eleutherodactylus coqui]|uniref:Uncharacterized protein n=1 Tax=Eleutherodactylus coqui TaxID=57060 RepID=A0A8J6EQ07_ELECQ|nr:hypothetical protein GDO78_017126 [Eleutherodactylus coqui]
MVSAFLRAYHEGCSGSFSSLTFIAFFFSIAELFHLHWSDNLYCNSGQKIHHCSQKGALFTSDLQTLRLFYLPSETKNISCWILRIASNQGSIQSTDCFQYNNVCNGCNK